MHKVSRICSLKRTRMHHTQRETKRRERKRMRISHRFPPKLGICVVQDEVSSILLGHFPIIVKYILKKITFRFLLSVSALTSNGSSTSYSPKHGVTAAYGRSDNTSGKQFLKIVSVGQRLLCCVMSPSPTSPTPTTTTLLFSRQITQMTAITGLHPGNQAGGGETRREIAGLPQGAFFKPVAGCDEQ